MSEERPAYGREIQCDEACEYHCTENGTKPKDSALEKWQSTAKELAEALELIMKKLELRGLRNQLHAYDNLIADTAVQNYKTLTDEH